MNREQVGRDGRGRDERGRDEVLQAVEEVLTVDKQIRETDQVSVRTRPVEEQVVVREELWSEAVDVERVPVGREIDEVPKVEARGDVTVVPIVEERLVVRKVLFLVEEIHLRRETRTETSEIPVTLRRTEVEVTRDPIEKPGD